MSKKKIEITYNSISGKESIAQEFVYSDAPNLIEIENLFRRTLLMLGWDFETALRLRIINQEDFENLFPEGEIVEHPLENW